MIDESSDTICTNKYPHKPVMMENDADWAVKVFFMDHVGFYTFLYNVIPQFVTRDFASQVIPLFSVYH